MADALTSKTQLWLCQRLRSWPVGEIGKEAALVIERMERELSDTREAYLNQSARLVVADEPAAQPSPIDVALGRLSMAMGNPAVGWNSEEATLDSALVDEATRRILERTAEPPSALHAAALAVDEAVQRSHRQEDWFEPLAALHSVLHGTPRPQPPGWFGAASTKPVSQCQIEGCTETRTIGGRHCIGHETSAPLADADGPGEEDGPWADGWKDRSQSGCEASDDGMHECKECDVKWSGQ